MKNHSLVLMGMAAVILLAGCGAKADTNGTSAIETVVGTTSGATAAQPSSATAGETNAESTDIIPSVMVDGVLYQDTGYVSSAIGCGVMDGEITSSVDGSELPTENNQSNFGTGYSWQRGSEGQIIIVMDARNEIFRDPNHHFAFDMPEEVLNFSAEVKEIRGDGRLLVEYIDAPEMFMKPIESVCVIPTDNLQEEVQVGDTVRVWFDGLVQELFPPILPNVYRIVKEETEPAESEQQITEASETSEYRQNADGSWSYRGRTYAHRLFLTGRPGNAAMDSFLVVLANTEDVTFEEMSRKMFSSTFEVATDDTTAIVYPGLYSEDCVVDSAKVVVSVGDVNPWGATVFFDQYDNTVEEELLTGEHFALDRRDGDEWIPVDPIITEYGFNDIGYLIQKGGITHQMYAWTWLYGKLEPGQYRIHVQVLDDQSHDAAAVFTITDGEYGPAVDLGTSKLFSEDDRLKAVDEIRKEFDGWDGCELHQIWFTSDEKNNAENVKWVNDLAEGRDLEPEFTECIQFKSNYHSPVDPEKAGAWNPDEEYMNWEWWLARKNRGEWHLMTWGY